MENSYWARFISFIKESFGQKFKAFFPGMCMGFIGAKHLLFSGIIISVVEYVLKFSGTVVMAFSSGLATAYASHLIDKYKNKNDVTQRKRSRKKTDRAA